MLDNGEIDSLQAVICNAGLRLNGPVSYTVDGYEETFATNYLGHFLLVELLLDRVADHGRIVFTASGTHDPDTPDGMMGIAPDRSRCHVRHRIPQRNAEGYAVAFQKGCHAVAY